MRFIVMQLLSSISYGSLLFMIASGFSLVFGLMKLINMVHVVFFVMAGYLGNMWYRMTDNFSLAILLSILIVCTIGFVVFHFFLFRLQGQSQSQVLLCLGFLFFLDDALLALFGGFPLQTPTPAFARGSVSIMGIMFPKYRLMLVVVGILVITVLDLVINHTHIGALVRSGVDDEETVRSLGVNINKLFTIVYISGASLAAFGGVLSGPFLGMEPSQCFSLLPVALAIVIVGGLGNLRGAFYASMIVATLDNFGKALFPELAYFTIFFPMAVILVVKPDGLFAKRRRN